MSKEVSCSYDSDWQNRYGDMITSPTEAVGKIAPGKRIFIGTGCGAPVELIKALAGRASHLPDTEIVHLLTLGEAPYADKKLSRYFRVNSFFIAENVRELIQEGLGDYTPIFLSDIPRLFNSGQMPLDVAIIQVTPPDSKGLCSLGVSVDIVKAAAENASLLIAEVNPEMPRTHGNSSFHIHDFDWLVPVSYPITEYRAPEPGSDIRSIGQYVAALVEDNSTLELGIGAIPQTVLDFLKDKKELGIHTEMFTDKIVDLVKSGVITGSRKNFDQNKIVASFCMGSKKLYDYINDNPVFSFHPTEYVNDPFVIGRHNNMVAINVALEVDLTGQVCADSLGSKFHSGIGGQVDFNRGAARSRGGRAIIAMPSTARDGTVSRIVSRLSPGAGVVTTRGDVHYVVTEHGVAYLHGKSVQERAIALISIAHPDFREKLLEEAIEAKYVRSEMADVEGRIHIGPPERITGYLLDDGTSLTIRSIHPTDLPRMKDLFYALSQETVYYRFLSHHKHFSQKAIQNFVYVDHRSEVAIVATLPEAHGEDIVAIGRYYLDPATNRAEVAFVVHDQWQGRGIGSFLLKYLTEIARKNGIGGFTAEVLRENKAMQTVLSKSSGKVTSKLSEGVYSFRLDF